MNSFHSTAVAMAIGVCSSLMLATSSVAQDAGKAEYMVACAGCHGESGLGQGPFSEWLSIDVPGLTGIAASNDGVFPYLDIFMVVDGRTGVRGHGDGGSMPIWGDRYSMAAGDDFGPYGAEVVTRGRIAVLVDYIESIQE